MDDMNLFVPLTKIDVSMRLVYGVVTAEAPDLLGEVCDYESTKPEYQKWSQKFASATAGKSNLRAMHGNAAAGKLAISPSTMRQPARIVFRGTDRPNHPPVLGDMRADDLTNLQPFLFDGHRPHPLAAAVIARNLWARKRSSPTSVRSMCRLLHF